MDGRLLLLVVTVLTGCSGQGNIGCIFSPSLCDYPEQWCFDDYVFGLCLPNEMDMTEHDFYQFDLDSETLALLKHEMTHLYNWGYLWSHPYTQCVLKSVLGATRHGQHYERGVCRAWADMDLEGSGPMGPDFGPPMMNQQDGPLNMDPNREPVMLDLDRGTVVLEPNGRPFMMDHEFLRMDPNRIPYLEDPDRNAFLEDPDTDPRMLDRDSGSIRLAPDEKSLMTDSDRGVYPLDPGRDQLLTDPSSVAFVKFQPSAADPHTEFADEVYFPPITDESDEREEQTYGIPIEEESNDMMEHDYNYLSKKSEGPMRRSPLMSHLLPPSGIFSPLYNTPDKFRVGLETKDARLLARQQPSLSENIFQQYNTPELFREGLEVKDIDPMEQTPKSSHPPQDSQFPREYNTPEKFRQGLESRDGGDSSPEEMTLEKILQSDRDNEIPDSPSPAGAEGQFSGQSPRLSPKLERLAGLLYAPKDKDVRAGAGYTEGGLVKLPDDQESDMDLDEGLDALMSGFKRPERLDVKKPGPLFTAINLAEQHKQVDDVPVKPGDTSSSETKDDSVAIPLRREAVEKQSGVHSMASEKKELNPPDVIRPSSETGQYDVVDTTFAYVGFKNRVDSWQEGRHIVQVIGQLLGLPRSTLSDERVDFNEVTFKVLPNPHGMNASEVARRINGIKGALKDRTGVEVTSAGIGDKTKLPTVLSLGTDTDHELYIAILLCGVMGSILVAATALFVIRRHSKSREKLQTLAAPDTEASKDYQELCRARMATKTSQDKPEPIGNRIASLSRESEGSNNSPSSRSSTSSWSEEPALTNMDISTGHMVLSYMEDHLKNKDRLDQEWVALCAYEAEPCAVVQAQKPDNIKKNRYNDVLPFDHSRVVLNDLANISGSDYINASTITDHDPRNPAYIATQGALPHTAADFWQLVWEQGSVVMVMLTRLTENGNAMCHRYWPEEGSELYHIYEVHLVSEHIWCDDYLVRSFYLKNLKTGETRTVTQFHFLSWPDNGVPLSTKALLEFRRKVNKSYRGRSCPIVVHCSDGAGRTGTYCVIDMVLNRMAKGAKEIDIAATLEHIRDQRANMVKTKPQFEFVLTAVAEEVNAILKALPTQQPPAAVPTVPQ